MVNANLTQQISIAESRLNFALCIRVKKTGIQTNLGKIPQNFLPFYANKTTETVYNLYFSNSQTSDTITTVEAKEVFHTFTEKGTIATM